MKILTLNEENKKNILENLLKRSPNQYEAQTAVVAEILNKVKQEKDAALFAYTKQFDKTELTAENIRVTEEEIKEAYEKLSKIRKIALAMGGTMFDTPDAADVYVEVMSRVISELTFGRFQMLEESQKAEPEAEEADSFDDLPFVTPGEEEVKA